VISVIFYRIIFPNIWMSKSNIHRILKPHQQHYYKAKCVSFRWVVMTVDCDCAISSCWVVVVVVVVVLVLDTQQLHSQ
jgi:hypothetical protein